MKPTKQASYGAIMREARSDRRKARRQRQLKAEKKYADSYRTGFRPLRIDPYYTPDGRKRSPGQVRAFWAEEGRAGRHDPASELSKPPKRQPLWSTYENGRLVSRRPMTAKEQRALERDLKRDLRRKRKVRKRYGT